MKHFLIKLIFALLFFFLMFDEVYADCAGGAFCYIKNALGVCDNAFSVNVCGGLSYSTCETAGSDMCECGVMHGGSCSWSNPCSCSWSSSGSCYIGGGGLCIRNRTCSCSPTGCGSCSGNNYTECAATECCAAAGTCTKNCGANASVPNGSCGTTACACVECVSSTPRCGQTTNCSGKIDDLDNGNPSPPTCSNLGIVAATPQTISWTSGGALADTWKYSVNGGAAVTTTSLSASVAVICGTNTWQAMAENTTCGTDDSDWSGSCSLCRHCPISLGTWTACDANHKRTRTCTENDGLCDGDECGALGAVAGTITQDCTGTITGTLFDASDYSSCPANFTGVPTINNQTFNITSPYNNPITSWPPNVLTNPKTLNTGGAGVYSALAFAPGTYTYDFSALSGAYNGVGDPKLKCNLGAASLPGSPSTCDIQPCSSTTNDFGFWRIYGGWWQAVGGSVYAKNGVKSQIPASLPIDNQRLIIGDPASDPNSRVGVLAHGFDWTVNNDELGTNPDRAVSKRLWRIKNVYEGLRYDYNYYTTRMSIFDSSVWDGTSALNESYDGSTGRYKILKYNSSVNLNSQTLVAPQKITLLVNGDVTVTGDIIVPKGAFLAVIAKGNITFSSNLTLTKAQGWFVAENINVPCHDVNVAIPGCDKDDTQFEGQGSFVGWSNISLGRDMNTANNSGPSEMFVYRPDFVLNAPAPIKLYTREFSPFIP